MVIGAPDKLTPDEARKQARKLLAQIELGRDPAAERAKARKGETVSEMLQLYMDEKIRPTRKRRTAEVFASYIRKHIEPAIGKRQTVGLSRADVLKLHHAIGKTHPVTANRVVTLIAAAFSHAKKAGMVPENFRNPAREIDKFREQARERYLSTAELQRLGDTLRLAETEGLPWLGWQKQIFSPRRPASWILSRSRPFGCCCSPGAGQAKFSICAGPRWIWTEAFSTCPTARPVRRPSCLPRQRWRFWQVCRVQASSSSRAELRGTEGIYADPGLGSVPTRAFKGCACTICAIHSPA